MKNKSHLVSIQLLVSTFETRFMNSGQLLGVIVNFKQVGRGLGRFSDV